MSNFFDDQNTEQLKEYMLQIHRKLTYFKIDNALECSFIKDAAAVDKEGDFHQ
jgi:hypothetical protein